ncbi:hypothetical protein OJF2_64160 [Aquisphaera giovannonii]|uniref:Serine protease n=1 Tax=Aquisphaera giovannonii TaxID=406548 RepID=A0A5B9WCN9_9BACT|nr:trypsin-like peptidase domain-containing protein [Aquisphaera giovannonii]QEH37825.1 hypothetical protein OJF2_64160 [Aquisphaera giovannonii]
MQSGPMRVEITEALLDAFPDSGDMCLVVERADIGTRFTNYLVGGVTYEQALHSLISNYADPQDQLLPLLREAQHKNPKNDKLRGVMNKLAELELDFASLRPDRSFGEAERIVLKGVAFEDVAVWVEKLKAKRRAVCRIEPQPQAETTAGFGSGFLVASDVVITNFHVAKPFWNDEARARRVVLRFGYETDSKGINVSEGVEYRLATVWRGPGTPSEGLAERPWQVLSSPEDNLDYALLRLDKPAGTDRIDGVERGFLTLTSWQLNEDDPLLILQHPSAAPLKLSIGAVQSLDLPSHVFYIVNTEGGSSGSPCLNQRLETVALHRQGESSRNRGVTFKAIHEDWSSRVDALKVQGVFWLANQGAMIPEITSASLAKKWTGAPSGDSGTSPDHRATGVSEHSLATAVPPRGLDEELRLLLRPLMGDRDNRRARLTRAFSNYPGLLDRINLDGETGVFLSNLINTLREYGEVERGEPALHRLLVPIKEEVGVRDRERIEEILRSHPR